MVNNKLINKELLHKKYEKNVLIYNLRRVIPNFLGKELFESILAKLSDAEKDFILKFYKPASGEKIPFLDKSNEQWYVLNTIITHIEKEKFEKLLPGMSEEYRVFMSALYIYDEREKQYRLTRDINEEEEKKILIILDDKAHFIPDDVKTQISAILEEVEEAPKRDIVYANIYVDPTHEFFFEHPNDHVPAMLILEGVRQFCMAVNHVYGKVPVDDGQLILENLEAKFFKYTEMAYPIILKGYLNDYAWNKRGFWSYLDFGTEIYQNSAAIAHFRLSGRIITQQIFYRIRKSEINNKINHYRFQPVVSKRNYFSIKNVASQKYIDVDVHDLSCNGLMLTADVFKSGMNGNNFYDFFFYFQNIGFVNGRCEMIWQDTDKAGFKITEISEDDFSNLKESMVKCCHVYQDRAIF